MESVEIHGREKLILNVSRSVLNVFLINELVTAAVLSTIQLLKCINPFLVVLFLANAEFQEQCIRDIPVAVVMVFTVVSRVMFGFVK